MLNSAIRFVSGERATFVFVFFAEEHMWVPLAEISAG